MVIQLYDLFWCCCLFRFNPYSTFNKCRICKQIVHQPHSHYCQGNSLTITGSWLVCIRWVMNACGSGCEAREKRKRLLPWVTLASLLLSNFHSAFIAWFMHTNHEPILFYNTGIILSNFSFFKHIESWQTCISMASLCHH